MSLNPYLYFDGQCEEAVKSYEERLGGKITFMMKYEGSPMAAQAPPGYKNSDPARWIGPGRGTLEGCDAPPGQYQKPQSFCIMFRPKDAERAEHVFHALADGGSVRMPIAETFWALRFGYVINRFEMPWLVNCEKPAA